VKVSSYDARSATISWTPPYSGNSPVTHYIVQWKPNDVSDSKWTSKEIINASVSGSENFATLRGLRPITRYDARVIAVNNLGKSDPSEPLRFSTDEEAPGGPPLHIKVTAVSSRSVKVSWKSPREDLRFGTIKGYYVGYKAASTDSDQFIYKTLDATKPDEEECFLHGLKRFTKYSITVQAFNSKGTGPSSEVIETQTLPNDPPSQPILKVNLVTTSSINLGWNVKQLTSNNEDIDPTPVTGFVVHTKKHESSSDWEVLRLSGDRNSHTFERLACGSKYQYYVVAFNAVGKSDPSEITTVKTEGSSPVAPDKHSLLSTNTTAAVIFLDAWHDGGCPISSFDITYRARKSNRVKGESKRVFPGAEKTVILKDLLPSTVYEIKMSAVNEAGITEAVYNFTTGSLIRAVPAGNDMASIHGSALPAPLTIDPIILPTTIALVSVVLLFVVVKLWFFRKRQNPSPSNGVYGSNYGSQGMYDMAKSQAGAESLCLTDMGTTCGVKKVNGCGGSGSSDDSNRDSGVCYPSPYELTKLTCDSNVGLETVTLVRQTNGHTMPLKTGNGNNLDSSSQEPTYATVKRTPRAPRNECHVYQYPLTLMTQDGSFFDAESCVSLGSCNTGPPSSTAYFRVQDDSGSGKPLSCELLAIKESGRKLTTLSYSTAAVPLLISEDGRIAVEGRTLDSIRRNGTNNCQSNFRRDY
jgi:Down syndrome cell adhesion protein